ELLFSVCSSIQQS
ncbi:unnamed protein product, partial [Allacma fusca]